MSSAMTLGEITGILQREALDSPAPKTALDLTPEAIETYRATAHRQQEQDRLALMARQERAWDLARQAATILRERYGVYRVVAFGSLVHPGCFTLWSDVDVAAWGISPQNTFSAIGVVMDLDGDIQVNLVDVGTCSASLRRAIEQEGVDL